jgi:hypothetical protein
MSAPDLTHMAKAEQERDKIATKAFNVGLRAEDSVAHQQLMDRPRCEKVATNKEFVTCARARFMGDKHD